MSTCPFCRIAADPAAPNILLQSELAVAFLDIRPIRPGHALVVPRRHEADFWSLTRDEQNEMMALANQLAEAQRTLFNPPKVGLMAAGFEIAHAHLHVLPLFDFQDIAPEALLKGAVKQATPEELAEISRRYARHFPNPV